MILQRFSLNRECEDCMIDNNVLILILDFIHECKSDFDTIIMQYLLALLMNLSLRTRSKEILENYSEEVIEILCNYIHSSDDYLRFYAVGTLYAILNNPQIREKAICIIYLI